MSCTPHLPDTAWVCTHSRGIGLQTCPPASSHTWGSQSSSRADTWSRAGCTDTHHRGRTPRHTCTSCQTRQWWVDNTVCPHACTSQCLHHTFVSSRSWCPSHTPAPSSHTCLQSRRLWCTCIPCTWCPSARTRGRSTCLHTHRTRCTQSRMCRCCCHSHTTPSQSCSPAPEVLHSC